VARRRSREGGFALSVLRRLRVGGGGAPVEQRSEWRVGPAGDLFARERIRVDPALPELARVGVCFSVAPGFEALRWLGRGPHESYADRKAGAALGLWSGSVDDQLVPYVRPQENGNKTDVRWFALERPGGPGLLVTAGRPFGFSALHATAADLHRARHPNELERRPEVVVNLDARQRGLGTGACGPDTLPAYRIGPGLHRFAWRLRPYDPRREAAGVLARQAFPAGGGAGGARRRGPDRAGRRER
jgi:beta-galactosidase